MRVVGIALFALIMSLNGFVFGVISIQLVPLLEAAGLAGATAVWVASLKGHGQFAGRLVEIFFGRNLKAMTIARIAIAVVPASLILLFLARGDLSQLVAFTLLLGASQGVITIVRGAVPLALFGTKGYGAVLGVIATPILLVNAFSPRSSRCWSTSSAGKSRSTRCLAARSRRGSPSSSCRAGMRVQARARSRLATGA